MSINKTTTFRYRLASMPYAQCRVEIEQGEHGPERIRLVSYETNVVEISLHKIGMSNRQFCATVYCSPGNGSWSYNCSDRTFSPTTARHINRFTQEFFNENLYQDVRKSAESGTTIRLGFEFDGAIRSQAKWYLENGKRYYYGSY